jgi:aspartyl aminopeptidase
LLSRQTKTKDVSTYDLPSILASPFLILLRLCHLDSTNGVTGFIARELARKADGHIPLQEFVVRSDCPCGTTIGPMISALTGIRTVDLGMPQLSMHSVREVMGIADLTHCLNLFNSFFANFNEIDDSLDG